MYKRSALKLLRSGTRQQFSRSVFIVLPGVPFPVFHSLLRFRLSPPLLFEAPNKTSKVFFYFIFFFFLASTCGKSHCRGLREVFLSVLQKRAPCEKLRESVRGHGDVIYSSLMFKVLQLPFLRGKGDQTGRRVQRASLINTISTRCAAHTHTRLHSL